MEKGKERRPRFWEQARTVQVPTRTYRCPVCGSVLFNIPYDAPIPQETEIVTCPNNHKVKVPKFKRTA